MDEMMEDKMGSGDKLMQVSCDPTCAFSVKSHDKQEIVKFVQMHAKKFHNKEMADKAVMDMMVAG
jgi:predicted small metal-binding protein